MKRHYIYRTTDEITGRWYIGMSYSSNPSGDGYFGGGVWISSFIREYGSKRLRKQVLAIVGTREEASRLEALLVTTETLKDPLCMNLQVGGYGAPIGNSHRKGKRLTSEHIEALRRANLGNQHTRGLSREFTKEHRSNMAVAAVGNNNQRPRNHSEETKQRMRISSRRRWDKTREQQCKSSQ